MFGVAGVGVVGRVGGWGWLVGGGKRGDLEGLGELREGEGEAEAEELEEKEVEVEVEEKEVEVEEEKLKKPELKELEELEEW